jgi:hypothetical protein
MDYSSLGFCGLSASFAPSGSSVGSSAKLDEREVRIGNSCRARQTAFLVERKAVLGKTSGHGTLTNDALDSRSPRPINSRSVNLLYYGDNLDVLGRHIKDYTIDLVYLDPPFNSSQDYNVLFAEKDGTRAASQFKAFEDTWEWNIESGGRVSDVMQAFRQVPSQ